MMAKIKSVLLRTALVGGVCIAVAGSAAAEVVTTSFQNGVGGYSGTFDRTISERDEHNIDGSSVINDFLDGYQMDTSPDEQRLVRFDNIIGSEPSQIPADGSSKGHSLIVASLLSPGVLHVFLAGCSFKFEKIERLVFSRCANALYSAGTIHGRSSLNGLSHPDSLFVKLCVSKANFVRTCDL